MYSLFSHGQMLRDRVRLHTYRQALAAAITPGMTTVLDLGTGTGIHALQACRLGAKYVWAIEPDPIIVLAQTLLKDNGYRDRVTCLQQVSTTVELPEPVDLIVSDLRGVLPPYRHHIPTILDARTRLLKPDGILIPRRDRIWVTLVNAPAAYANHVQPWASNPDEFNFQAARAYAINRWSKTTLQPEHCLVNPQIWADLDYKILQKPHFKNTLTWTIAHPSITQGLGAWFETELHDNIGFSTAPDRDPMIYGQGFFPFEHSLELQPGDRVQITLHAHLIQGEYLWQWLTSLWRQGQVVLQSKQSTFAGQFSSPIHPQKLRE